MLKWVTKRSHLIYLRGTGFRDSGKLALPMSTNFSPCFSLLRHAREKRRSVNWICAGLSWMPSQSSSCFSCCKIRQRACKGTWILASSNWWKPCRSSSSSIFSVAYLRGRNLIFLCSKASAIIWQRTLRWWRLNKAPRYFLFFTKLFSCSHF